MWLNLCQIVTSHTFFTHVFLCNSHNKYEYEYRFSISYPFIYTSHCPFYFFYFIFIGNFTQNLQFLVILALNFTILYAHSIRAIIPQGMNILQLVSTKNAILHQYEWSSAYSVLYSVYTNSVSTIMEQKKRVNSSI